MSLVHVVKEAQKLKLVVTNFDMWDQIFLSYIEDNYDELKQAFSDNGNDLLPPVDAYSKLKIK